MSAVQDQLAKLNPNSGAQQLLGQIKADQVAAQPAQPSVDPLQQIDAKWAAEDAEQARIEKEHSYLGTIATQGSRGLLSAVLGSGALLGAGIEGVGTVTGWDGARDFGRDLGTASSGKSAMEAAAFLFGGGGDKGVSYAEQAKKTIEEQERAFPTLSTASQVAGQLALAFAGGAVSTASRGGALIAMNAAEGAGAGAQSAYEQGGSFRDVLTSTLLGAAIGGGVTAAGEALPGLASKFSSKSSELEKVFGKSLAEEGAITVEQAGGREARSVLNDLDKARKSVAQAVESAGDNPTVRAAARKEAETLVADELAQKAGKFNPATWADGSPTALQKVVYRGKILDQVSEDLAQDVSKASALRPSIDFEIGAEPLKKLLKDAEGPEAIGGVQSAIRDALESVPATANGDAFQRTLRIASDALDKADLPQAMQQTHALVKELSRMGAGVTDDVTKSFADRTRQAFVDQLKSESWGKAGKLYGTLTAPESDAFRSLLVSGNVRDALRNTEIRGQLPTLLKQEGDNIAAAIDARAKLSGTTLSPVERKQLAQNLRDLETRFAKGEEAVTLDGGPAGRVIDFFKNRIEDKVVGTIGGGAGAIIGGPAGAMLGAVVANAIRPALKELVPVIRESAGAAARYAPSVTRRAAVPASYALTQGEQQEQYNERLDYLARAVTQPTMGGKVVDQGLSRVAGLPPMMAGVIGADYQAKLNQLLQDTPKPKPNIRGKAYETLSSEDLRLANAMWEATTKPLSVFDDFRGGFVDYDKTQYAWKQYPGLKQAAQFGLMDIFQHQLSEEDRAGIPDPVLSQLDNLFGMEGTLQPSLDRGFSYRISQMATPEEDTPKGGGKPLDLTSSEKTFTERIANP